MRPPRRDVPADAGSLTEAVTPIVAGAHVTAAAFLGTVPVLALGDGALLFVGREAGRVEAHPDAAILVAASDGKRIVTGGDDGRLVATAAAGASETLASETGAWIDALALHPTGAVAWAAGRQVRVRPAKGEIKGVIAPSSVRGLDFAPKGFRLAFSHYNGASLWFPNATEGPEALGWKGSHLDVTWSPDGRFVVTSMQENAMHGWRIADGKQLRMTGYPAKPRSMSWSADGNWLATSGAEACVIWPFEAKDGPMGKAPRECGVRNARVSQVAFHPKAPVLALGYEDGLILLTRLSDGSELLVRKATPGDAISAFGWSPDGQRLLFGTRDGAAGLMTLPA